MCLLFQIWVTSVCYCDFVMLSFSDVNQLMLMHAFVLIYVFIFYFWGVEFLSSRAIVCIFCVQYEHYKVFHEYILPPFSSRSILDCIDWLPIVHIHHVHKIISHQVKRANQGFPTEEVACTGVGYFPRSI